MKHRTSFALDQATADRLQRLARRWNTSQAEVVRRAVALAADRADGDARSIYERLEEYRTKRRLDTEAADAYLQQVRDDRTTWDRQW